jgi:thiosulfate/3-mercaptopyruvate sulfurtransferase
MLHLVALAAALAAPAVDPIVSTEWLQTHLKDRNVLVVDVSDRGAYDRSHIAGAVFMEHMATVGDGHRLLPADALAKAWAAVGVSDDTHVVLYGDTPMATGWMFTSLAAIGHGERVSMLDGGIKLWQSEKRPTETAAPKAASGTLAVRPASDAIVDAQWVRARLDSPQIKLLDVRTSREWDAGHLPNATLILWQDLFADRELLTFKSRDEIRAMLAKAGVGPNQEAVTYCMVGLRASLMYVAARAAGVPARVYVGSWQDWSKDPKNPVVR